MKDYYRLSFVTTTEKIKNISVAQPDRGLSEVDVVAAAQKIIDANIFRFEDGGSLQEMKKVDLISVHRTVLI